MNTSFSKTHMPIDRIVRKTFWIAIAGCLLFCIGCGRHRTYRVTGTVVYSDTEEPAVELAGYMIYFESTEEKVSAIGEIQDDASFTLSTEGKDDGAIRGEHKVYFSGPLVYSEGGGSKLLIHSRYALPSTTDIVLTVKRRRNRITIPVDRPERKAESGP